MSGFGFLVGEALHGTVLSACGAKKRITTGGFVIQRTSERSIEGKQEAENAWRHFSPRSFFAYQDGFEWVCSQLRTRLLVHGGLFESS